MAKQKLNIKIILAVVLTTFLMLLTLVGCEITIISKPDGNDKPADETVAVTAIQLKNTLLYMSPTGEPSKYKFEPTIVPANATNKKLTYQLLDVADGQYLQISANGEIQAQKEKAEGDIKLRIFSQQNRSCYIDVSIIIEKVAVTKISFAETDLVYHIGQKTDIVIKPIFTPAHAIDGRDVTYKSLNEDILTVDANGVVLPKKVGSTRVEVATPADTTEVPKKGWINIKIMYAPLAYQLELTSPEASLKQITTDMESIVFTLLRTDENCDPNPRIRWYISQTAIDKNGITDNKTFSYVPTGYPFGEYVIRAEITDASTQKQELISQPLFIYEPLENFDITLQNPNVSFSVGDMAIIKATVKDNQYPPESYNWYLKKAGDPSGGKEIAKTPSDTFNYQITESGNYELICKPVVKGKVFNISKSISFKDIEVAAIGDDIYDLYVDGAIVDGIAVPYIKWLPLPYQTIYEVQIKKNDIVYTLQSDDVNHKSYFTLNGIKVPITVASLEDSFSYRVKTSRYGYSDWTNYVGSTIATEYYRLLANIVEDYNGYVVNMEELGALINYVSQFRPESIYQKGDGTDTRVGYHLEFITTLMYLDNAAMAETYPVRKGLTSNADTPRKKNVFMLVAAAFNAYCETGKFDLTYDVDEITNITSLWLRFEPLRTEFLHTANATAEKMPLEPHYTKTPQAPSDALPIDSNPNKMVVSTSNQLFVALSAGYNLQVVAGSAAEKIYNEVRAVANRICDATMTEAQKAHAIYDYLTCEIYYDWALVDKLDEIHNDGDPTNDGTTYFYDGFLLEGVFLNKKAVCDGIAKAFNALCWVEGIRSQKVVGSYSDVGHAWNIVSVSGEWYGIDATWGSLSTDSGAKEIQHHQYLLITDKALKDSGHVTYGKYNRTADAPSDIYYKTELVKNIDPTVVSDEETCKLIAYMAEKITNQGKTTVWLEVVATQGYISSIPNRNIIGRIQSLIQKDLAYISGLKYGVTDIGDTIVIHLTRN